jgi:hypothetical protein
VLREGEIVVRDDVEEPTPAAGQVLVQVKACGICGSDLHFARHGAEVLALGREVEDLPSLGTSSGLDLGLDVYMGHEFAAEVLELGPGTDAPVGVGTLVTSMPALVEGDRVEPIVYSNTVHGGYGERMLLSAPMLLEVPNGLPAHHAALTEPMAVGLHAVNRSEIERAQGRSSSAAGRSAWRSSPPWRSGASSRSWPLTSPPPAGCWHRASAPTSSWTRGRRRHGRRGAPSAPAGRCTSTRRSACPGSSTTSCGLRRPARA